MSDPSYEVPTQTHDGFAGEALPESAYGGMRGGPDRVAAAPWPSPFIMARGAILGCLVGAGAALALMAFGNWLLGCTFGWDCLGIAFLVGSAIPAVLVIAGILAGWALRLPRPWAIAPIGLVAGVLLIEPLTQVAPAGLRGQLVLGYGIVGAVAFAPTAWLVSPGARWWSRLAGVGLVAAAYASSAGVLG